MASTSGKRDDPSATPLWEADAPERPSIELHRETETAAGRIVTPDGGLNFINLQGTLPEMAGQMGRRMRPQIQRGPLAFYATYLHKVLRDSPVAKAADAIRWATHRWATSRLAEGFDGEFRQAIDAMAEATGRASESLLKAYTLPETFLWLVGKIHGMAGTGRAPGLGQPPFGGCTSAVLRPPAASTTLHARNFDYFGVGFWEETATLQFFHPDEGLDYVAASTAGMIGGGITAMNAAGLTLAAHQHVIDDVDLDGVPVGVAGTRVMRRARNIREAVEILRDHPPVAGWSYVLTEGDTGQTAIFEVAPGREFLYRLPDDEPRLGYTNVYWGPQLEEAEVDFFPEYRRNTLARQTRALELTGELAEADGVDPAAMAELLADFHDPTEERRRLCGRTIAAPHTISSVVFEPEARRIWVGSGDSPAARSWFVPFRLGLPGQSGRGGPDPTVEPFHPSAGWDRTAHGQAFARYREACYLQTQDEPDKRLLILIEHALALYPDDPSLHVLAGLLALRSGRPRRAEGALRSALERLNDLPRRTEVTLYLAWALDVQEQRSSSRQLYREIRRSTAADPAVTRHARIGRWLAFNEKKAAKIAIDFVHVSAV
jgi:hypothetical protein